VEDEIVSWKRILVLVIAVTFVGFLSACAKKEPLADDKKDYAGRWVAGDGTFVVIYLDGGGDFKTSNSNVSGGNAKFKDNKLVIGLGPIEKEFVVSEGPKQGANGAWVVTLDGNAYTKSSQATSSDSSSTDATGTDTSSTTSTGATAPPSESK
jgi:hypothetical protein